MELNPIVRNQRLVMHDRSAVVLAGNIGGGEHGADTRHRACSVAIDVENACMCMRRLHWENTEHAERRMLFVGVNGASGHVTDCALMAIDPRPAHAACSATNCRNRLAQSSRR